MFSETDNIRVRYERRTGKYSIYNPLLPSVYMPLQERERYLIKCIKYAGLEPVDNKKILEVGCGSGANFLQFLKVGFVPENMVGIELLQERADYAEKILPSNIKIRCGDALEVDMGTEKFDIIVQMTVFSSLLDSDYQQRMANWMWNLVKPGGGILWYDFIYNNPKNKDVMGVPPKRIKHLFPEADIKTWHVTLAPPINRLVTKVHPSLYTIFNFFPFLRTHALCWLGKEK